MKKFLLIIFSLILMGISVYANNVQISNIGFSNRNTTANTVKIGFDASWENSWRTTSNENNYDGLWVFAKFRKINTSSWQHCSINNVNALPATGSTIQASADKKGFWLYRSANGIGNVNFLGSKVEWDYGTDNVADGDSVEIRLFAIEMVYVPQGSFFLGSGGSENFSFSTAGSTNPYQITSEAATSFGSTPGNLTYSGAGALTFSLPITYPKGFNAFWIMKYEASQQQYVDFLNTLDQARASFNGSAFLGLTGAHPNFIAPQPTRAVGVSTDNFLSISDFSAMRPMTELEYEKACRGAAILPVPNEYPWGNTFYNGVGALLNTGLEDEAQASPTGNSTMNAFNPNRCGLYATSITGSQRDSSGGTFYGGLDMGGNVFEKAVNVQTLASRNFTSTIHGDGIVGADGFSNITTWNAAIFGIRGAAFNTPSVYGRLSDRYYFINGFVDGIGGKNGIRMVRTAE